MNPYIGWSKTQLETALASAQADLAVGKITIEAGSGDVHGKSQVSESPLLRIRRILTALNALDPTNYPSSEIAKVTRTRIQIVQVPRF